MHDQVYKRGGRYKNYSDIKATQSLHRVSMYTFIASFVAFTALQALFPHIFTLSPSPSLAASSSWTFGTQGARNGSGTNIADTASGLELQQDWWDTNYKKRQKITVNSTDAVASGYSVKTDVDIENLRRNGKVQNDLDDLRVVATDRSSNTITELDRDIIKGESINLDGSSQYINITDSSTLEPTSLTIEAWVKSNNIASLQSIVSKGSTAGATGYNGYVLRIAGSKIQVVLYTGTDVESILNGNTVLSSNTWYHLAMTYNGSTLKVYLNGTQDNSMALSGAIDYTGGEKDSKIGASSSNGIGSYFNGQIDEARVSNVARTIDNPPRHTPFEPDANTKGLWHLDGDAGDSSGNGNNGTLNGSPYYTEGKVVAKDAAGTGDGRELSSSDSGLVGNWKMNNDWTDSKGTNNGTRNGTGTAFTTSSKLGSHAGLFNGSDDYVDIDQPSAILSGDMTIEAWIKPAIAQKQMVISLDDDDGWWKRSAIYLDATGVRFWYNGAGSGEQISLGYDMSYVNKWTHIAVMEQNLDTTATMKLYINGIEVDSGSNTITSGVVGIDKAEIGRYHISIDSATDPLVQTEGLTQQGSYFNGEIDEAAIYNRALSRSEIQDHYNAKSEIWFKTQSAIDASSTSEATGNHSYFLYYDYASATNPPENKDNIYDFYDDFEDGTIDTSKWDTAGAAGTWTESSGQLHGTGGTPGYIINKTDIPADFYISVKSKASTSLAPSLWPLSPDTGDPFGEANRLGYAIHVASDFLIIYHDATSTSSSTYTYDTDTWYGMDVSKDGSDLWMQSTDEAQNVLQTHTVTPTAFPAGTKVAFRPYSDTQDIDFIKVRAYTTNEPTTSLTTEEDSSGWATGMGSWTYKQKVTFDTTASRANVGSNQANFPVLIKLNSNNFNFTDAKTNGEDIRFFDSDNSTSLSYEIESWDQSGEEAYIWIKVPQVDGNSATDNLIMYYGNAGASDAQSATSVWDDGGTGNYKGVWHLSETSGQHLDSTSNNNDSTSVSVTTQGSASGQINGADDFNGTSDNIFIPNSTSLQFGTNSITVEAWADLASSADSDLIFSSLEGTPYYEISKKNDNLSRAGFRDNLGNEPAVFGTTDVSAGGIRHIVGVLDRSAGLLRIYVDGVEENTAANTITGTVNPANSRWIGMRNSNHHADGIIDEVRISNTARSADWVKLTYESGRDNLNYYANRATYNAGATYPSSAAWTSNAITDTTIYSWGNLTFTDVETGGTVSYQVTDNSDVLIPDGALPGNSTGFGTSPVDLSGLSATTYGTIKIKATLTSGASTPSISALAVGYSYDNTAPTIPTNLAIGAVTTTTVPLSWTASVETESGIAGYEIQRAPDSGGSPGAWNALDSGSSCYGTGGLYTGGTSCDDDAAVSANTKYWYRVRAKDNVGLYSGYTTSNSPAWYDANWLYRKKVTVDNTNNASALTNYQVLLDSEQNVVGNWHMDENTGTTANDSSRNSNNGTMNGTSYWTASGKYGAAFNGSGDDWVNMGDNVDFERTSPFALEAWTKRNSLGAMHSIVGKREALGGWTYRGYHLFYKADDTIQFSLRDESGTQKNIIVITDDAHTETGQWVHWSATYDGSSTAAGVKIYKNGALVPSTATWDNLSSGTTINTGNLTIGGDNSDAQLGSFFDGVIDEVKIYDKELTSAEVQDRYNDGGFWQKVKSDGSDIRITDNDGTTLLDYWIEEFNNTASAKNYKIWTKVPSISGSSTKDIYMNYGNASASAGSDGGNTFEFFDDFSGAILDTGKWQQHNGGTPSFSGGELTITANNTNPGKLKAITAPTGDNYIMRAKYKITSGSHIDGRVGVGIKTGADGNGYNYIVRDLTSLDEIGFLDDTVAWNTSAASWAKDTWYIGEIFHDGTNIKGRIDDGTWQSQAWSGRTGYPALNFDSKDATSVWDWAVVRQYTSPEPTAFSGAEELPTNLSATTLATPPVLDAYSSPTTDTTPEITNSGTPDPSVNGNTARLYDTGDLGTALATTTVGTPTANVITFADGDFTGALSEGSYNFVAKVENSEGVESAVSNTLAVTIDTDIPTTPVLTVGSPTTTIPLTWTASTDTNFSGYEIERADDSGGVPGTWAAIGSGNCSGLQVGLSCTDDSVSTNSKYHYRIRGKDTANKYSYYYQKNIVFDTTSAGANTDFVGESPTSGKATDFPVAVHISSSSWTSAAERDNFFDTANVGGKKVTFYDADNTTVLDYEVEYYDQASEEAIYWVRVPQLDGNSNSDKIIVHYGGDPYGENRDNGSGVWDANFRLTYHLNDDNADTTVTDSTSNANNGTKIAAAGPAQATAFIGNGQSYDGIDDNITLPQLWASTTEVTTSMWFKSDVSNTTVQGLFGYNNDSIFYYIRLNALSTPDNLEAFSYATGGGVSSDNTTAYPVTQWRHLAITAKDQGGSQHFYVDGTEIGTAKTITGTFTTTSLIGRKLGAARNASSPSDGVMDEARFSNTQRSADWIKLEYFSMKKTSYNGDNGEGGGPDDKFITHSSQAGSQSATTLATPPVLDAYSSPTTDTTPEITNAGTPDPSVNGNTARLYDTGDLGTALATTTVGTPTANVITFADGDFTGALSEGSYNFVAKVENSEGVESAVSNTLAVTIDTATPTVPTNLTLTAASGTQIDLSWSASTDTNLAGYKIERAPDSGGNPGAFAQIGTSATTSWNDNSTNNPGSPPVANTKYWYRVRAYDTVGKHSGYTGEQDVDANVAGLWHLNEGTGGTTSDVSGNSNTGTLNIGASGTQTTTTQAWDNGDNGKHGQALNFDGTDDYVDIANPANLAIAAPGTLSFWVKTNSDTAQAIYYVSDVDATGNYWDVFIGNGSTGSLTDELITITRRKDNVLTYTLGYTTATRTELIDNAWHHVAITANGSQVSIYIDGVSKTVSVGSGSNNGTFADVSTADSAGIGSLIANGGARSSYFNGLIDEVRISNIARTGPDILNYYNESNPYPKSATTLATPPVLDAYSSPTTDTTPEITNSGTPDTSVNGNTARLYDTGDLGTALATTTVGTPTANVITFADGDYTSALSEGSYNFVAKVENEDAVESAVSNTLAVTIDTDIPTTPVLTVGTPTTTTIPLTWTASTDTNFSGYEIERAPDSSGVPGTWAAIGAGNCSGLQVGLSCTDDNVTTNVKYWYRIRGKDTANKYSYYYQKNIVFDTTSAGANVGSNQSNFPVAVHINSSSWTSAAERDNFFDATATDAPGTGTFNLNGKRVKFYDADGTTSLDYEVEFYDALNQEAVYWVRVPQVDGPSNSDKIIMHYGNDPYTATQDNATGVWDGNYKAVLHMSEGGGVAQDSTTNNNDAADNASATGTTGHIYKGQQFDGINDNYQVSDAASLDMTNGLTVSAWANGTFSGAEVDVLAAKERAGGSSRTWALYKYTGEVRWVTSENATVFDGYANYAVSDDVWLHITGTYEYVSDGSSEIRLFIDGVERSSDLTINGPLNTNNLALNIGDWNVTNPFTGYIDEIRISDIERSADWTKLEYFSAKKTAYNGDNGEGGGPDDKFITHETQAGSQSGTTLANVPGAPTVDTPTATTLDVTIDENSNPAGTEYAIQETGSSDYVQADGTLDTGAVWQDYTTWGGASGQTVTGLSVNTQHTFQVKARNVDDLETAFSSTAALYTLANVPGTPTVAGNWSSANGYYTDITVNVNGNPGTTDFAVSPDNGTNWVQSDGTLNVTEYWTTSTSFTHKTLTANTSYSYKAKARNGESTPVETALNTTAGSDTTPPAQVTGETHTGNAPDTITWDWADTAAATSYKVYAGTHSGGESTQVTGCADVGVSTCTATGLSVNTLYTIHIHANNANGTGADSATTLAYTSVYVPGNPTVDTATTTSMKVTVDENSNPGGIEYAIQETSSGNYVKYATGNLGAGEDWQNYTNWGGATGFTVTGLTANKLYTFQVKARNTDSDETAFSGTASQYTLPLDASASSVKSTGTWYNTSDFDFTNDNTWGEGGNQYYRYVWDTNVSHTWTDTEDTWANLDASCPGGTCTVANTTLALTAPSDGNYYLHLKSYGTTDIAQGGATPNYGAYQYDGSLPDETGASVLDSTGSDITWVQSTTSLSGNWSGFTDATSGIASYAYSIGTTAGATDVVGWTNIGGSTSFTAGGLSLTNGQIYYVNARATDNAGNNSPVVSSDGQTSDTIGPDESGATLRDGTATDIDWAVSTTQLSANWPGFTDATSGIASYDYTIGTTPGGSDIVSWTSTGATASVTKTGLSLTEGQDYYFTVRAIDNATNVSTTISSDGQTVDTIDPSTSAVLDPASANGDNGWYTSAPTVTLSSTDTTSGVENTYYSWNNAGGPFSTYAAPLTTPEGDNTLYFYAKDNATNQEGNKTQAVKLDSVSPTDPAGLSATATSSPQINLSWTGSTDATSGLYRYVVTSSTDNVTFNQIATTTATTYSDQGLTQSTTYYYKIKAKDNAGLLSNDSNTSNATTQTPASPPSGDSGDGSQDSGSGSSDTGGTSDGGTGGSTGTGGTGSTDTPETVVGEPVDPEEIFIEIDLGEENLPVEVDENNEINILEDVTDTIHIALTLTNTASAKAILDGKEYDLTNTSGDIWEADITVPKEKGTYTIKIKSTTKDGKIVEQEAVTILIDPSGYVYDEKTKSRIANAEVVLYENVDGILSVWDAAKYNQVNPQSTNKEGRYGFMTPAGTYIIKASAPGYLDYTSNEVVVEKEIVTVNIPLTPEANTEARRLYTQIGLVLGALILGSTGVYIFMRRR